MPVERIGAGLHLARVRLYAENVPAIISVESFVPCDLNEYLEAQAKLVSQRLESSSQYGFVRVPSLLTKLNSVGALGGPEMLVDRLPSEVMVQMKNDSVFAEGTFFRTEGSLVGQILPNYMLFYKTGGIVYFVGHYKHAKR